MCYRRQTVTFGSAMKLSSLPGGGTGTSDRVKTRNQAAEKSASSIGICGTENQLLAALRSEDRAILDSHSETVPVNRGMLLAGPNDKVEAAYFPMVGTVVSLSTSLDDGRTVEAATVGCEGVIGGIVSCGTRYSFASAVVQISGATTRVPVRVLENLKDSSPQFRRLLERYSDFLFSQALQSVACNAFHSLEQRLCRWLLTTQDRVGTDAIPLTQEALADMIGVQRTSISTVSRNLRARGLLRYRHGSVDILNREGLHAASCGCYDEVEKCRRNVTSSFAGSVR